MNGDLLLVFSDWECGDGGVPRPIPIVSEQQAEAILEAMRCCINDGEFKARVEAGAGGEMVIEYFVTETMVSVVPRDLTPAAVPA